MDKPSSIHCRKECLACGECLDRDILYVAKVDEASKKDDRQGCAVVLNELPHISLEQLAFADDTTPIAETEHEQSNHNCNICGSLACQAPLSRKYLYYLLEIDAGHIEAEDIAGETRDVGAAIASLGDGQNPVHDE